MGSLTAEPFLLSVRHEIGAWMFKRWRTGGHDCMGTNMGINMGMALAASSHGEQGVYEDER